MLITRQKTAIAYHELPHPQEEQQVVPLMADGIPTTKELRNQLYDFNLANRIR